MFIIKKLINKKYFLIKKIWINFLKKYFYFILYKKYISEIIKN